MKLQIEYCPEYSCPWLIFKDGCLVTMCLTKWGAKWKLGRIKKGMALAGKINEELNRTINK
jgi:hypothetical protein